MRMNEWCVNQHGLSDLTAACLSSPHKPEEIVTRVEEYVKKWIPEKGAGLLAGSSVHADARCVPRPTELTTDWVLLEIRSGLMR